MSNNIDITLAAQDQSVQQTLDKMNQKLQSTEVRLEKLRKVSKTATYEANQGFNNAVMSIDKTAKAALIAVANFGLWRTAAREVGKEIERNIQLQEKARSATLEPAEALRSAIFAMEDDATVTGKNLEAKLMEISQRRGVDFSVAARVFEQASSSKGSGTNQDVLNAMEAALLKTTSNESEAATLAVRNLNLSKVTGTKDMGVNMGVIQQLGSTSMVKDFESIGESLVPAVIGLTKLGASVEEASELVSATTHIVTDKEGDVSARAVQILSQQVMSFQPERNEKGRSRGRIGPDGRITLKGDGKNLGQYAGRDNEGEFVVPDEQVNQFTQEKRLVERMRMLRESTELRRLFLSRLEPGSLHLPTKSEEGLRGLIRGDEREMLEWQKTKDVTVDPSTPEGQAKLKSNVQEKLATMDSTQLGQMRQSEIDRKSAEQVAALKNVNRQRIADARKEIETTLANINLPGVDDAFLVGQKQPLMMAFNAQMARAEELLSQGKEVVPPEAVAAAMLEKLPRKGGTLSGDLSREDQSYLESRIGSLRKSGESRGNMQPFNEKMDAQTKVLQEQTQVLREISGKLGNSSSLAPRQTERPSSRVSRGNQ